MTDEAAREELRRLLQAVAVVALPLIRAEMTVKIEADLRRGRSRPQARAVNVVPFDGAGAR